MLLGPNLLAALTAIAGDGSYDSETKRFSFSNGEDESAIGHYSTLTDLDPDADYAVLMDIEFTITGDPTGEVRCKYPTGLPGYSESGLSVDIFNTGDSGTTFGPDFAFFGYGAGSVRFELRKVLSS